METTTLMFLFRVPSLKKSVSEYLGFTESIDKNLSKLLQSDFNAGIRCLRELLVTTSEQEFLLKEAWRRFHTALTNEAGERKALAYIGLALCQDRLGESELATRTLQELVEQKNLASGGLNTAAKVVGGVGIAAVAFMPVGAYMWARGLLAGSVAKGWNSGDEAWDFVLSPVLREDPSKERVGMLIEQARELLKER
jgi:hypothetical protein